MSTRCVLRVKKGSRESVDIYHHYDGYPEGVGMELVSSLFKIFKEKQLGCMDAEYFVNKLVKNRGLSQDDDGFSVTLSTHGDLEFFYELDFGTEDELRDVDIFDRLKCWPLRFDFDGDWEDYGELKEKEVDLRELWERENAKANAEQKGAQA